MTYLPEVNIKSSDSPSIDAFARLRVSNPQTIFDSKQLYDKQPLIYDEVLNGSATSVHSATDAATSMSVSVSGDYVIRQTKRRFNYQPGKSQLLFFTGILGATTANVVKRIGYFNSSTTAPYTDTFDGLYFEDNGSNVGVCVAKSGSVTRVAKTSWNLDKLDGTGPSGIIADFSKDQIFLIDFEWLGVGRVRFGLVIDGIPVYAHEANHANLSADSVYMSSPNHSVRYEIRSTGGSATLKHICCSVMSEGGLEPTGVNRSANTGITAAQGVQADVAGTSYAILGFRLKSTHLDATFSLLRASLIIISSANARWQLLLNPTVTGTFTYSDVTNSAIQVASGSGASVTVSGGTELISGYTSSGSSVLTTDLENVLGLGSTIAGVRDEIVFTVTTNSAAEDVHGSIDWRELL